MAVVRATQERVHLMLGIAQGAALFFWVRSETWLNQAGLPAGWFSAVLAWAVFAPLMAHLSLGTMGLRRFWALMAGGGAVSVALGYYQGITHYPVAEGQQPVPFPLAAFVGMALLSFMIPPLVAAWRPRHEGAALRHWHYPTLFDLSWRNGVVIFQGALLAALLWLVLLLGTAMLGMVGIHGPGNALTDGELWLWILPAAAAWGTGIGIHRPNFTLALRRHWFVFSRWMLPLVSALGVTLVMAGLYNLQAVSKGTLSHGVLLLFVALWVMLYSCAFEAGESPPDYRPRSLKLLQLAALGLVALLGLSVYGFAMHELPGVLSAGAFWTVLMLCVGTLYALGYGWSGLRHSGAWMASIGTTNVLAALVAAAGIVLLLSPLLDVRHLAAQSLVKSLGNDPNERVLHQLRTLHNLGLPGHRALVALSQQKDADGSPTPTAKSANDFLTHGIYGRRAAPAVPAPAETPQQITGALFRVHPRGTAWPPGLYEALAQHMRLSPAGDVRGSCYSRENSTESCQVLLIALSQDGQTDAVIWTRSFGPAWVFSKAGPTWAHSGRLNSQKKTLHEVQKELEAGRYEVVPPRWHDLRLGTETIEVINPVP